MCISVNGEQRRSATMSDREFLPPKAASKYIAEHSVDVKVSQDGVVKTAHKACSLVYYVLSLLIMV